jgi:uncharacterized protein YecE (DUF72 family)
MPGRKAHIRVGIGGWTYEPWRETFYPPEVKKAGELAYASRHVTSIEINATYYRTQSPQSFRRWAGETPDDFVFAVKANRFATNRKDLADAGESIARFVESGLTELGSKLGPLLWQLAPTKRFEAAEIDGFLASLPRQQDGLALRHVVEVRHASFVSAAFVALARAHNVAICLALSEDYPLIADPTADFCYLRLQTTSADAAKGYDAATIEAWAARLRTFQSGDMPTGLPLLGDPPAKIARDCFAYMISGAKERNPSAAAALIAALGD